MTNLLQRIAPEWPLRISLGVMYLYSGTDIIRHPTGWHWAIRQLPDVLERIVTLPGINNFLFMQGIGEIFLAFLLLAWFLPRKFLQIGAAIVVVEMVSILLFVGIDLQTFRDIGLLGAGAALLLIALKNGQSKMEAPIESAKSDGVRVQTFDEFKKESDTSSGSS